MNQNQKPVLTKRLKIVLYLSQAAAGMSVLLSSSLAASRINVIGLDVISVALVAITVVTIISVVGLTYVVDELKKEK